MRRTHRATPRSGFTLIELVVVMTIIALLATAVAVKVNQSIKDAKRTKALADIKAFETGLAMYAAHNGSPPTEQQGLEALIVKPTTAPVPTNWRGKYVDRKSLPLDPWGHEYVYKVTGDDEYEVLSYGADGQPGGTGEDTDISTEDAK